MSITDKTRKMLWAKSGNRCSLCRIELVQKPDALTDDVIIGRECHIISQKVNGPRSNIEFNGDFDSYENLILLCANDHARIDELIEIYFPDKLKTIKKSHENWVKTTLEKDVTAFANDKYDIKSLPKITSGKEIVDIMCGAHMFDFNNDELKTEIETTEIGGFFDELKDYVDILSDLGFTEIAKLGLQLNDSIDKLKRMGFLLFGLKRKLSLRNVKKEYMGSYETATIIAVRDDNASIVDDFLIAQFPTKISFI